MVAFVIVAVVVVGVVVVVIVVAALIAIDGAVVVIVSSVRAETILDPLDVGPDIYVSREVRVGVEDEEVLVIGDRIEDYTFVGVAGAVPLGAPSSSSAGMLPAFRDTLFRGALMLFTGSPDHCIR